MADDIRKARNWVFGYCDSGNPKDIKMGYGDSDQDALDDSYEKKDSYDYVSAVYYYCTKAELIELIKRDGWWYKWGEEAKGPNYDQFPVDAQYMASAKKSKKMNTMAKNEAIRKSGSDSIKDVYYTIDELGDAERFYVQRALDNAGLPSLDSFRNAIYDAYKAYFDDGGDSYYASAKKSKGEDMDRNRYEDIQKRLNKIGGFTKEDEDEEESDVEIEVEVDGDEEKPKVDVESDDDNVEEFIKGCKTSKKRVKMRKAEDMPEDADDQQDQNEKGSGNAGSILPEDADDNQDQNEKGSGNAGKELPEDADDQQDIKESANKKRMKMRKFSVTPGGQPNQESYNGRYQQAPMVRDAIDGHFGSKTEKFNEVDMMNERINDLLKSRRNPVSNNGVPKRIR